MEYELQSDLCTNKSFDNIDTANTPIRDIEPGEDASYFCTYTSFDNLDTASATTSAYKSDFCINTHFDNLYTNRAAVNNEDEVLQWVEASNLSDIIQFDGADTVSEKSNNDSINSYNSQDEADSEPGRTSLIPSAVQGPTGAPVTLEFDLGGQAWQPSYVPLCAITNPRSGWNKINNIFTFLHQVCPDFMILSEHWGRKKLFENALGSQYYRVIESSRGTRGIPTRGKMALKLFQLQEEESQYCTMRKTLLLKILE